MNYDLDRETVRLLKCETLTIFSIEFFCCLSGFANLSYYQGNSDGSLAAIKAIIWFVIAFFNVNLGWHFCQKEIRKSVGKE